MLLLYQEFGSFWRRSELSQLGVGWGGVGVVLQSSSLGTSHGGVQHPTCTGRPHKKDVSSVQCLVLETKI